MKRRNLFSLSHYKLLTAKMGYLYPIACMDVLPGDTFQMATSLFVRFSPMVAPVMTPVTVKIHHWYVPLRLIWDDFEDFMTGGADGMAVPVPPTRSASFSGNTIAGNLRDYLGLPPAEYSNGLKFSALYERAYALIWNEWYRDQNLQDPVVVKTTSGTDSYSNGTNSQLLRSAWDKDYFTTATPWEQKGAAVAVPMRGLDGQLSLTADGNMVFQTDSSIGYSSMSPGTLFTEQPNSYNDLANSTYIRADQTDNIAGSGYPLSYKSGLKLNIGDNNQVGINLNDFREAMALQRFEEHRALYGSRYVEYLRYLGIHASDGRLQRPEYLGGGRSVVQFSEVLQTAEGTDPVGTMRGHGIGALRTNRFRRFFEEHGILMTLMSVRPKAIYTQGMPRKFFREIKTDYWQKEFEHVGQQEVKNREIYTMSDTPDGTFGYSDRYDEYRHEWSSVHGEFRDLLDYWHLGRKFDSQPVLNGEFINSLPSDRIFADQTGTDTMYIMVNNSVQARRLVSRKGTPR